ncbi:MAG: thiamine phosphate synthase, partial [Marivita lacus]|nr:thiamine phosphate synthase [Marivita lacus]
AADAVREVAHRFDVALVIDTHVVLAQRLGLDGVHLTDGARSVRMARKELGEDAIVGAFCGQLRHDGISAGEAGADYVSFGPVGTTALGDGSRAEQELFEWWSEMIEIPVVAEGGLDAEIIRRLAPMTDFFGIGEEIWRSEDPVAALKGLTAAMAG